MTTHDREKVISAARERFEWYVNGRGRFEYLADEYGLERLYSIAYEAGRVAERIVTIKDDDDLRFIKRVLEGNNPAEEDKSKCIQLIHEIRSRARSTK